MATASPATGTLGDSLRPRLTKVEPLPLTPGGNPRITRVEPLPDTASSAPAIKITPSTDKPTEPTKPAKPEDAKPTSSTRTPISEMDDGPELMEPLQVAAGTADDANKDTAKPAAPKEPEKKPAAEKASGKYAIQLASFKGSAGQSKADDYAKRVSKTTGRAAEVTIAGDVYRVVIGGFSDKASATEACNKLKQNAEFKDAFVKVL